MAGIVWWDGLNKNYDIIIFSITVVDKYPFGTIY